MDIIGSLYYKLIYNNNYPLYTPTCMLYALIISFFFYLSYIYGKPIL